MLRLRIRIRFSKKGDLRFVSHLDLMRAFERALRRSGLPLRMTEGFNPHPRMSFPAPLAVGIEGSDEVMEFEVKEEVEADDAQRRLEEVLPPGIAIQSVELLELGKATQVEEMTYVVRPADPSDREAEITPEMAQVLLDREEIAVERVRKGRRKTVDIRPFVLGMDVHHGTLRLNVKAGPSGSTRPEEVLAAMGYPPERIPLLFRMERDRIVLSKPRR